MRLQRTAVGQAPPRLHPRSTIVPVNSIDLTDSQTEALFAALDRHRRYLERLHARCVARGFPAADPLRAGARAAVLSLRRLCLTVNDGRRKGLGHRYQKSSRAWPAV